MIPDDFGSRLREIREQRNLSGRDLAQQLDNVISQSGICRLEKGTKLPTASELLALSWALGVSIDELIDEHKLSDRVRYVARSTSNPDLKSARDALLPYLQLRITLNQVNDCH
ncbi:helix-turn-helix domain-containing protein [Arcanobacterium bovis]|uniref:XRE family transcriptional regulator n=1 Tax=Arcanobacterium bovis TaxID=2529275 RepID=A0A4Q9UYR8_9ACTO|nr:helix-turn-helix transcriptional regulator [Arcanobacterium bovis]TBW20844.1 XRE family transcriptional regulator [Arcanobacterium bovis]